MSEYRATFDDTFGNYNEKWSDPTKGPMVGRVIPGSQNLEKHRVDVFVPHFNLIHHDVRVAIPWSAGSGTGIHALPHDLAEVHVQMKHGKSAGVGHAEVTGVVHSEGEFKAPHHPSLEGQKNFFAIQGRLDAGDSFNAGTLSLLDEKGGQHNLVMGKETHHSQGATDSRHKGISMTEAEHHGMFSSNVLAQGAKVAGTLKGKDMKGLAQGFSKLSNSIEQAKVATTSAALAHVQETLKQAETVHIGLSADAIAQGDELEDI